MIELVITTRKEKGAIDITDRIANEVDIDNGLCHLFVAHTTAALATADLDPGGTDLDYLDALSALVPKLAYRHPHDPSHMPDHVLSSLIGTSLTVPVMNGKLALGTWQRIVLFEFDGPRDRRIIVSFS